MNLRAFLFALSIAPAAAADPMERKGQYALQTLAIDGGTFVSAAVVEKPAILALGYVLGPPIVHLVHYNPLNAAMSFALRIAAPLVLGFAARAADGDDDAMVWGAVGGAILASTVDAAALAREPVAPPRTAVVKIGGTF